VTGYIYAKLREHSNVTLQCIIQSKHSSSPTAERAAALFLFQLTQFTRFVYFR